jgi:hypothetical protein
MKRIAVSFVALVAVLLSIAQVDSFARPQSSIVGTWDVTIESPQGKRNAMLVIRQDGGKLAGAMKSQAGERPLDSITLKGDDITFAITRNIQGQDMVITYKGKVEKGSMKGDADFGGLATGTWSAAPHKEEAAPAASAGPSAGSVNITGVWAFAVETAAGSGTPTFTFKQDGESLTGTYKGQFGEAPLTGTVKGSAIKFTVKVNAQGQDITINYTGTIENKDSMKGNAAFGDLGEGTWTAKRK